MTIDYHDDMEIKNFSLQIAIIFFKFDTNIPFSSVYKFVGLSNTIIYLRYKNPLLLQNWF